MVDVTATRLLSDAGGQGSRQFPGSVRREIEAAIDAVPDETFTETPKGTETTGFDELLAQELPEYETEAAGRCRLWDSEGFGHSVDLYHPGERVAVEVEKSEQKYVWRDLVKFSRGGTTLTGERRTVEYGCLIVPVNYRGRHNVYSYAVSVLEFMRPILFVDDVAVIGYRIPGWE